MELTQEFEARLTGLEGRIVAIRSALSGGSLIEMTVLDRDLRELCMLSEKLPSVQARRLRPRMINLLDELTHLEKQFREALDELGQEIATSAQRQRATQAYSSARVAQR